MLNPIPVFSRLEPEAVWQHFSTLCSIPRASKAEAVLRDHLAAWARQQGLGAAVDAAGNLIIRKAASPGWESAPGVVLQGHLDMVCQCNSDVAHDFSRDPIVPVIKDGWLVAPGTTLGADNGIGVALILAVLEDKSLRHGPLEALLTVDEEAGMGGARGLAEDALAGRLMLNLDTEAWGEFYLGCAGGMDVNVARAGEREVAPAGHATWRVSLRGLRGGHSGVDIHEERGNAIKLLVALLCDLASRFDFRLAQLKGGTARNAIPREAWAVLTLPEGTHEPFAAALEAWQIALEQMFAGAESGLEIDFCPFSAVDRVISRAEQAVWLNSLHAAPYGVYRQSREIPGVVETSNNLGIVELSPDGGQCNFMVRSLRDAGARALAAEIASLFALSGSEVVTEGDYPGWSPNPDSPLLAVCQQVFAREFGEKSAVRVIHAGLECGIIGGKYPTMDMVSFGPTIHGAHAPGERVEIASVGRCWTLLKAILETLGKKTQ